MTDATNAIDAAALGRQAVEAWKQGDKANGKGDSLATFALFQAWHTQVFEARVFTAKGQIDRTDNFELRQLNDKPKNADHSKDTKLMNARTKAVCEKLFGIAEPDNAFKQRIGRTMLVVTHLAQTLGLDETMVSLSKRNNLTVPFPVMNPEPDGKASENERRKYEAMSGETWEIDGKQGNSLAELGRRAKPPVEGHAKAQTTDSGASFIASVDFVTRQLQLLMDEKADNAMPALNNDMRKKLHDLVTVAASYFDADPVEEDKEGKLTQRKAA